MHTIECGTISGGGMLMLRTITIGSSISVQGVFVEKLPDGRIAVRVGSSVFAGRPVTTVA